MFIILTLVLFLLNIFSICAIVLLLIKRKEKEDYLKNKNEVQKEKIDDYEYYIRMVKKSFQNLKDYRVSEDKQHFAYNQIADVRLSVDGRVTFIILDNSYPRSINLQIISGETFIRGIYYQDRPNLCATYYSNLLHINDIPPNDYQHMGYGTMLLDTLDIIAKSLKAKKIYGDLVGKNEKRDDFYRNNGYNVYYNNQFGYIEKIFQY